MHSVIKPNIVTLLGVPGLRKTTFCHPFDGEKRPGLIYTSAYSNANVDHRGMAQTGRGYRVTV